jgi:hypothetical protein
MVGRLYWDKKEHLIIQNQPPQTPSEIQNKIVHDTVYITEKRTNATNLTKKKVSPKKIIPQRKKITVEPTQEKIKSIEIPNKEIRKYYTNKKLSVLITPWEDGRRNWHLYDLYGNETIMLTEVNLSYSVFFDAAYHPNGAVQTIHFLRIQEQPISGMKVSWNLAQSMNPSPAELANNPSKV